MSQLFNLPFVPALDLSGHFIGAATLLFYASGTSVPAGVYADADLSVSLGAVVSADSYGRFPAIYLDDTVTYRVVLKDSFGATVGDVDPIGISPFGDARTFSTVSDMLASPILPHAAGTIWRAGGYTYSEASSSATDQHLTTAGGVKLYAIPVGGALSVDAFNVPKDGVTDSYPAFLAAYNASPDGATIIVPHIPVGYYLSADPDNRSKSVTWELEANTALSGPGMGDPSSGAGTFGSLYTNPWLRVLGSQRTLGFGTIDSPAGGAIIGDSWEFEPDPLTGWPVNFTGTVTNGSATITGISPSQIARVYKGCRITSAVGQWGWNGTQTVNLRVLSVDHEAGSITVGQDVYGNWVNAPFLFLGATTTGASFTVHKRQWFAGRYEGLDTGTQDASIPGELHYEICNPVMNITGAPGAMYEFDLNVYADTADYCRALFITGSGNAHNDKLIGIDLQRGGESPWATAVSIRNATVGLFTNAQFPIKIDTEYTNIRTDAVEKIGYGIHFNNISGPKGALFEGAQLSNGGDTVWLQRATDASPTGTFMNLFAADGVTRLGYWSVSGEVHASGMHVLDGFDLNLGSSYTPGAPAATGYTTIKIRGVTYKVLVSS